MGFLLMWLIVALLQISTQVYANESEDVEDESKFGGGNVTGDRDQGSTSGVQQGVDSFVADPSSYPDMTIAIGSDPHLSVLLPTGQLLCFTVQGEAGMNFNLISTKELEMNAQFVQLPDHPNNTWLGALGITVAGRKLIFNSTIGQVSIENKMKFEPSSVQKISVRDQQLYLEMTKEEANRDNKIEVDIQQLNLQFTVVFVKRQKTESKHLDVIWKSGGIDTETVHGLLGQFLRSGIMIDEDKQLLILPGRPAVPVVHQKIFAFIEAEAPQYKGRNCWTAKKRSNQGVGVIEGSYIDYEVNSLLSTGFTFGAANNTET